MMRSSIRRQKKYDFSKNQMVDKLTINGENNRLMDS